MPAYILSNPAVTIGGERRWCIYSLISLIHPHPLHSALVSVLRLTLSCWEGGSQRLCQLFRFSFTALTVSLRFVVSRQLIKDAVIMLRKSGTVKIAGLLLSHIHIVIMWCFRIMCLLMEIKMLKKWPEGQPFFCRNHSYSKLFMKNILINKKVFLYNTIDKQMSLYFPLVFGGSWGHHQSYRGLFKMYVFIWSLSFHPHANRVLGQSSIYG